MIQMKITNSQILNSSTAYLSSNNTVVNMFSFSPASVPLTVFFQNNTISNNKVGKTNFATSINIYLLF